LAYLRDRTQINKAEKHSEARDVRMSQCLLGFIDETKTWQADLVDTLHRNRWQPNNAHDTQLFAHQLDRGAQEDRKLLDLQRIHHLLQFDEIAERRATIAEAHKKTFDWVFLPKLPTPEVDHVDQDSTQAGPEKGGFMKWLLGDQNLYWITGKPGSGKSTLMKYLFDDNHTLDAVSVWSGGNELITAGFFFWNSGTAMQMSRMGLLQTLLYQCLRGRTKLIPSLFPTRWTNYTFFGGDVRSWTWLELINALKTLISMKEFRFLLFIDGLDEFDGVPSDIVLLVQDLIKLSPQTVKICVASRPWPVFEESFRKAQWLRMEDLTRQDIQLYIEDNMKENSVWLEMQEFTPKESAKIIAEIIDKAVGVFLWVTLVVASLLQGLRDGDSIEDLWDRLDKLPSKLEDLFKKILEHLNPDYFTQACELFQLVLVAFEPPTLLEVSLALDGCAFAINAPLGPLNKDDISARTERTRRRIMSRCKGLIETPTAHLTRERAKVEYLHRTVRDFFKTSEAWSYIRSGAPDFNAPLHLAALSLRLIKAVPVRNQVDWFDDFWQRSAILFKYAQKSEQDEGIVPIDILDGFNQAGDAYWNQASHDPNKYATLLDEVINQSPAWRGIMESIKSADDIPRTRTPHWVNTSHIARMPPGPLSDLCSQTKQWICLHSFFDIVFLLQFDSYASSKITKSIAQNYLIGGQSLLSQAVDNRNYTCLRVLLELGENPNAKYDRSGTVWTALLAHLRRDWVDLVQERQRCGRLAAESFLQHGADVSVVWSSDLDTIFNDMEDVEKAALLARMQALQDKQRRNIFQGAKKRIKKKYKSWSLSKS
jgi:hypothetical protein